MLAVQRNLIQILRTHMRARLYGVSCNYKGWRRAGPEEGEKHTLGNHPNPEDKLQV